MTTKFYIFAILAILLGCYSSHAEKIIEDFTAQTLEWSTANDNWKIIMEPGCMNIEPIKNKNLGMALLFAGNGPNVDTYRAAIIPDIANSYATSFKFGITFSFKKYVKGQSETGLFFNYIDEDNYSAIYLYGNELIYGMQTDGEWNIIKKKKVKWPKIKKGEELNWQIEYADKNITFWAKGYPEFKITNVNFETSTSTVGIFVNRDQQLSITSVEYETF